jgi:hypothetical protein
MLVDRKLDETGIVDTGLLSVLSRPATELLGPYLRARER